MRATTFSLTATANDVARLAGVSQSAVSRAFTEGASISEAMRRRVQAAADTLGYHPNLLARSLITKQSKIVGVAVGNLENPFFAQVLDALSARLSAAGLRILMFTAEPNAHVDAQIEEILRYRIDSLILLSASLSTRLAEQCGEAGIPVLFINRTAADAGAIRSVTGDNRGGALAIGRFLLEAGFRKLAFMAGFLDSSTSRDREEAFTDYLLAQGMPPPLRAVGHFTREGAIQATRTLLDRPDRPDVIFCANDYMAIAAIEIARSEFGLEIGRDLAIVGFDDVAMAAWPSFSLTTYSQPVAAMVERGVELLQQADAAPDAPYQAIVPGELIVRGSTGRRA